MSGGWNEKLSKFFDIGFAVGFAVLAVLYPIEAIKKDSPGIIFILTITGYYIFFCFFMLAVFFR